MSGFRMLPPAATVEDAMDDVALTPYNRPQSAFNFEGWQDNQTALPQILPRSPPPAISAVSTDSDPDAVVHSTTVQFRPQGSQRKGKQPASKPPTPFTGDGLLMKLQLQRLQHEKDAALQELQRIKDQQVQDTGLLQRTAANVQNTANTATAQNAQLATGISEQLADIANLMNTGFARINEDLRKSFVNQNTLYNTMERRHRGYEQRFTQIEQQLARLQVQPHSPQPRTQGQRTVHLLEQAAATAGVPPPPVPPPSRSIINATPSPPPQRNQRQHQNNEWVAGKAPTPQAFGGKQEDLEGWLLQMDDFFKIT